MRTAPLVAVIVKEVEGAGGRTPAPSRLLLCRALLRAKLPLSPAALYP
jgi:hypothetical protein